MSQPTIDKCISCLEPTVVNHDQLCETCSLHNDSVDGTLLALLTAERRDGDQGE